MSVVLYSVYKYSSCQMNSIEYAYNLNFKYYSLFLYTLYLFKNIILIYFNFDFLGLDNVFTSPMNT